MSNYPFPQDGLITKRLMLRKPAARDAGLLLDYLLINRDYHKPWEPLREPEYHTIAATEQRLADIEAAINSYNALYLLMCDIHSGALVGLINFTHIVRGPLQACYLGFSLAARSEAQGLMFEALDTAIAFMFNVYQLHRIMANHRPENSRSSSLLKRLGFEVEGKARAYLKINGEWADHILTARICETSAG